MEEIKSFFNSIISITSYTNLSERRNKQLNVERGLDQKLVESYKMCPCTTFSYVMETRKLNRVLSERIYNSPFHQYPAHYVDYMDTIDKIQNVIGNTPKEVCQELKEKTNFMKTVIQK